MKPADTFLRFMAALLPPRRRQWGRAMRAELASLNTATARWLFAAGCVRAVLSQVSPRSYAGALVSVLAVSGAIMATGTTTYVPLRLTLIAYVALLIAVAWAGRLPSLTAANPHTARVRVGGMTLVGVFAIRVVTGLGTGGNPLALATTGVPIMAAISVCYLVAVLLATAVDQTANGAVPQAAGLGLAAGGLWTIGALMFPPVPAVISTAVLAMAVAALVAIAAKLPRGLPSIHLTASAMTAAATCAVFINVAVILIGRLAPVRYIPLLPDDGLLPHASRIAQSRTELNDPYITVIFLGALAALVVISALLATRTPAPQPVAPAGAETTGYPN